MSKEDEYRKHAAETVDLATRASSTAAKGRLLGMAEAWLELAERARRVVRQDGHRVNEHPHL